MLYDAAPVVIFIQTNSLKKPYGLCGTQPLRYYNPNALYTVARCEMECAVTTFVKACGCKEVYMPGTDQLVIF